MAIGKVPKAGENLKARGLSILPKLAIGDGAMSLLGRSLEEVWLQTRDTLISLLHRNYPLGEERLWNKLHIFDSSEFTGHTRFFRVALSVPSASVGDMFEINMALGDFADNFRAASQGIPNVEVSESITPDLLSIAYIGEGLLHASQNLVYSFHPDNSEAWAHLQSAMHVLQRIRMDIPAHKLN